MSGLMYSRAVLNSALFSFTLRQFMLRILRFCFFGRSYGHSLVVVLKSLSLGVLWEFCELTGLGLLVCSGLNPCLE